MAQPALIAPLSELERKAQRLNQASDSLNLILSQVEERLVHANVGVEVWLRKALASTDSEGSTHGETTWSSQFLGFAKLNGRWCLAIKPTRFASGFFEGDTNSPYQNEYSDGAPIPLSKASRDLRIAAVEVLPDLINLLAEETDRCVRTIERASDLV